MYTIITLESESIQVLLLLLNTSSNQNAGFNCNCTNTEYLILTAQPQTLLYPILLLSLQQIMLGFFVCRSGQKSTILNFKIVLVCPPTFPPNEKYISIIRM